MVLIGVGQGLGFAPLTSAGVLVAVSANAGSFAGSVAVAYTGGSIMLAAALLAALVFIVPAEQAARRTARTVP